LSALPGTATGVVLAGGQSRRMGQSKAALMISGEPLLRRITARLHSVVPEVLVIGPAELGELIPGVNLVPDLHPGVGPLGGIEAALLAMTGELAFVTACDMPFLNPNLVAAMLDYFPAANSEADIVALARAGAHLEHLHAVYRRATCLGPISDLITEHDYALHHLFSRLHVEVFPSDIAARIDPRGLSTRNINTPTEWLDAIALFADPAESERI
jgi:molybdopterin-guanine dinucleotide biosynthesis protein A